MALQVNQNSNNMFFSSRQLCLLFIVFCSISVRGQVLKYNPYFVRDSAETVNVSIYRLTELGTHHYDETWNAGNIYLRSGDSLMGYYIRYDIVRNTLEVIVDNAFQSVSKDQVAGFDWFSVERLKVERFTNRDDLGFETEKFLTYFPEILEDGPVRLLKVKEITTRRSANSPLLINNETESIVIMDKLFYFREGELTEVSGGRGKNLDFFHSRKLEDYVRENNFNFSNEGDVKRAVRYFNAECLQ